jgi:prepilin-type N-terminal cleavage/methylation domain-containing protein
MKKAGSQFGFTLLELIVVIGLVALAAAVTVAALNSARNNGRDAAIKTSLANIRQHAESDHLDFGSYDSVCGINGVDRSEAIADLLATAVSESPSEAICASEALPETQEWAISVELAGGGYWCVDRSGFSGQILTPLDHSNDISCQ